jgi:hypothetical protein
MPEGKKKKKVGGDISDCSEKVPESEYFPDIKKLKKDIKKEGDFEWEKAYGKKEEKPKKN